jgi:hypothetical protein
MDNATTIDIEIPRHVFGIRKTTTRSEWAQATERTTYTKRQKTTSPSG